MVLVTGATGFLGSVLVRQLVEAGEAVRILRRSTSNLDLLGAIADKVDHAEGDITQPASVQAALDGIEQVYHVAAFVGFGGSRDAEVMHRVNVKGTAAVLDASREAGVQRVVHTSSMAAFGRPENEPDVIDETAEWRPSRLNTAYAVSKHEGELEAYRAIAEGLDVVIVNPALIFGPGRTNENTMEIVARVQRGMRFAPDGGTNVVDVEDVAAGMRAAMERGKTGERYFLGSENLRWMDILGTLATTLGRPKPWRTVPEGPAVVAGTLAEIAARATGRTPTLSRESARVASRFYQYSNRKARQELGCTFRPFSNTAERIAKHVESAA